LGFIVAESKVPYITNSNDLKITEEQFCKEGDLIIADASEDYKDIGKAIEIRDLSGEKVVAGLHTFLARDKREETVRGFKGYLFQTIAIRKQIQKIAQGISVLGISKNNLSKVIFSLPCKNEQIKIVAFLDNLDSKISAVSGQLAGAQKFKKGLLQQMFV
jgi:type I restriction enzyme S subunit